MKTVYEVELAYNMRGDAGPGLAGLGASAAHAEKNTESLRGSIMGLAAAVGGLSVFHQAKTAFIDFNKEVESARINIAAVQLMFGQAGTMDKAMQNATGVYERYQQAAKSSTATTKEFLDMHLSLGPTFAKFGVGGKKIEDIVQGATVAAPILGERPETFAMDVKQMLQGSVTLRDRSAVSLLSMLDIDREEFNRNTKKDINYAVEVVGRALNSPAIMAARKEMENSFAGVTSTLEDTLQILAGEAGQPLFAAVTEEIKSWNKWLESNRLEVDRIKNAVSGGLVTGFRAVQGFTSYLVENRDTLMMIGTLWASLKGVQVVGGAVGGISEMAASFGKLGVEATNSASGIAKLAGTAASAAGSLFMLYQAANFFAEWVDAKHKRSTDGAGNIGALQGQIGIALGSKPGDKNIASGAVVSQLREAGALTAAGTLDRDKFRAWAESQGEAAPSALMLAVMAEKAMKKGDSVLNDRIGVAFEREDPLKKQKQKKDPSVNVTIQRVEVASDDPDRFVMGIIEVADRAVSRPSQARAAIPMR